MTVSRPVALVTGATGGMGREIVRDLARTHRVVAVGRNADRLDAVAADTGAEKWRLDITDETGLAGGVAGLERLDVLVNAAAIARAYPVADAPAEEWAEHFAVNVTAQAVLTRLALPLLRESRGTVVFIGSGASTRPAPGNAIYTATKHALKAVADVLRIDEEPHRVRVATVAPGPTDTEMWQGLAGDRADASRCIRPESVAEAVRFVVDAPADVQITDLAVRPRVEIARH
ncbi:SDR family oxidoreductase [Leucobacter ruminantium]|uniref:SDR family oxidoreductase n=1 Tax=Leucobacter ruminantium TaxID=1289170 RepID=A0A939LV60_9MICO|nr:SDR family oxidoreductase [Leucobacter ruminantium]MBO1805001.1 SDR family oxidoreductase [Leucobacter ruminantium]